MLDATNESGSTMLIREVERFLRRHDMPATKFGRLAARDPRFVLDLRMGRIPRTATEARTRAWMKAYDRDHAEGPARHSAPFETKGLLHAH